MAVAHDVARAASWLVCHMVARGVVSPVDKSWAYNRILEAVGAYGPACPPVASDEFNLDSARGALAEVAVENDLVEDSATGRDRAAMRVAGCAMPRPSEVISMDFCASGNTTFLMRRPRMSSRSLLVSSGSAVRTLQNMKSSVKSSSS